MIQDQDWDPKEMILQFAQDHPDVMVLEVRTKGFLGLIGCLVRGWSWSL